MVFLTPLSLPAPTFIALLGGYHRNKLHCGVRQGGQFIRTLRESAFDEIGFHSRDLFGLLTASGIGSLRMELIARSNLFPLVHWEMVLCKSLRLTADLLGRIGSSFRAAC